MTPPLVWTREAPRELGWYWLTADPTRAAKTIVRVERDILLRGRQLIVTWTGDESVSLLSELGHGEWAGPIEPPPLPQEPTP